MNTQITLPKVTRKQALEDLIDRILDDTRDLGFDSLDKRCLYDQRFNGGCAIGTWIPRTMHKESLEGLSVQEVFFDNPEIALLFEEPKSEFWGLLQIVHDKAARIKDEPAYRLTNLDMFQDALLEIASMDLS